MNQMDKVLAGNLRRIRMEKKMSLELLAEQTGVSKSMLGQIERGESNPTVTTIGKIMEGLRVSFEDLVKEKEGMVTIMSSEKSNIYREKKDNYIVRTIFPYQKMKFFEVYECTIMPGVTMTGIANHSDSTECCCVLEGSGELIVYDEIYPIKKGDSARAATERGLLYRNSGTEVLRLQIIVSHNKTNIF